MASLLKRDFRATSTTSIWMFFVYGSAAFFTPLIMLVYPLPWMIRGGIYAMCIFLVEYVVGMSLRGINACPWDYSTARYNVQGIIRLDYAPVWFGVGLIFEFVAMRLA
ncbi:MAG: hypothetical protein FWC93_05185 [Defluviitaleaceae bacterium]|nr:hypothetical protein [Defluviitaleaceae bacterium]